MRTEYVLMARAGRSYTSYEVSRHATTEEAYVAAGHPNGGDWRVSPSGSIVLREEVRAAHYDNSLPWLIGERLVAETDAERIALAIQLLLEDGQTDGAHHKTWVIDQALRILTGDDYERVIAGYCDGEDGPETYSWDEGVAP